MKRTKSKIVIYFLPLFLIISFYLIGQNELFVENYFFEKFFQPVSSIYRSTFNQTNLPIGQLIYYSALLWILIQLVKNFVSNRRTAKGQRRGAFTNIIRNCIFHFCWIYVCYMCAWGLLYHRKPLIDRFGYNTDSIATEELITLANNLILKTNLSKASLSAHYISIDSIYTKATSIVQQPSIFVETKNFDSPNIKSVLLPETMSITGISGIYFPFTTEANINTDLPRFKIPFVVCHELAHQLGFASEAEANYVSYKLCISSKDVRFRYSAYYAAMSYTLRTIQKVDINEYKMLRNKLSPAVSQDIELSNNYWAKYESPFHDFNRWFYDLFLKANQQQAGIKSYDMMTKLLIGEQRLNAN